MYIVYMVYIVYAMYAVYRSLPPVVRGGVDRRAYPVPPHTIGGGGAVITDHGIIYINPYCIYQHIWIYLNAIYFVNIPHSLWSHLSGHRVQDVLLDMAKDNHKYGKIWRHCFQIVFNWNAWITKTKNAIWISFEIFNVLDLFGDSYIFSIVTSS